MELWVVFLEEVMGVGSSCGKKSANGQLCLEGQTVKLTAAD